MRMLLPKEGLVCTREMLSLPLFFLAGPVLGGGDWQAKMARLLEKQFGPCIIVNPCRYTSDHPLYERKLNGLPDHYPNQTLWERHYMEQAAEKWPNGCLIFWLATESQESPRTDGKPYAMDTRGEIGEWRGRFMHNNRLRVVLGGDEHFPGLRTIERNNHEVSGEFLFVERDMKRVPWLVSHVANHPLDEAAIAARAVKDWR